MKITEYLKKRGIKFNTFTHPPVYTCEEAERYNKEIRGIRSKNLFIKDRKSKRFYLVIIPANKKLELDRLEVILQDKLKFANNDDLKNILGLESGAVSPFGLINDKEAKVDVAIDKEIWNSDFVSFHPNINTETLELSKEGFHAYISSLKNKTKII